MSDIVVWQDTFMSSMVVLIIQLNYAAAQRERASRGVVQRAGLRYLLASGTKHLSEKRDKGVNLYFITTGQPFNRPHFSHSSDETQHVHSTPGPAIDGVTLKFEPTICFIILLCSGCGIDTD
jgi:hypothetical protein